MLEEFAKVEKQYLEKFGDNSLDRVVLFDPLHPTDSDISWAIKVLTSSLKTNTPLPQLSLEEWQNIVF